jgi:RAD54-like protein 2
LKTITPLLNFRRSHAVLRNSLPQKEEYVLLVRMTAFQRTLYDTFMNEVVRTKAVPNPLKAFAVCCKVTTFLYNDEAGFTCVEASKTARELESEFEGSLGTKNPTPDSSNCTTESWVAPQPYPWPKLSNHLLHSSSVGKCYFTVCRHYPVRGVEDDGDAW